ncbi:MAG: antitoxin [Acidobacteriota bacterium]
MEVYLHLDISASLYQNVGVRTTLTIDDDVYNTIDQIARASGRRMGQVLSELARRGLQSDRVSTPAAPGHRFPVFDVAPDAPIVSAAHIQQILETEETL